MAIRTLFDLFNKAVHHTHKEDTVSTTTPRTLSRVRAHQERKPMVKLDVPTHTHDTPCVPPEGRTCMPTTTKGVYWYPYTNSEYVQHHLSMPTHTHTKEAVPMHYKLTLTTRTTMVWAILSTLSTLVLMGVRTMVDVPTWGGVYTLLTVGVGHSLLCTLVWGATHVYVRRHGTVVLSTRNLGR